MSDDATAPLPGIFHPWPPGTLVWECTTCRGHFAWSERSLAYGNIEEAEAVFCSKACADKWTPPVKHGRPVLPYARIDEKRQAIGRRSTTPPA